MQKTEEQVRRAYRVLDFIEAHPEKHDQSMWISNADDPSMAGYDLRRTLNECGTTACFAGWDALLAGETFTSYGLLTQDRRVDVYSAAALGLTVHEAYRLFHGAQDMADVRKEFADIFGPRPDGAI